MRKLRYPMLAGLLGLSMYLFPVIPKTFIDLNKVNFRVLSQPRQVVALRESRMPRGGETVLPLHVQQMLSLLRLNGVKSYRYSPLIERNPETQQRLTEGAYPLRVSKTATHVLVTAAEEVPVGCRVMGSEGGILLVHCP